MKNICFLFFVLLTCFKLYAKEITLSDIKKLKEGFENKHSISLYIKNIPYSTWKLDYKIATKDFYQDLAYFISVLDKEFSKYPQPFLRKTRLKGIVLVRALSIYDQYRSAIPDYYREIIFYDFFIATDFKIYQKDVIHHEFYHMIEQQFNGSAYWKDPTWISLNDPKFKYGSGGWAQRRNSRAYDYTHPQKGFVNLYSMSGAEEDKAEIFASLFVQEEFQKVLKWSKSDEILNNKINYMMAFLGNLDKNFKASYWVKLNMK